MKACYCHCLYVSMKQSCEGGGADDSHIHCAAEADAADV